MSKRKPYVTKEEILVEFRTYWLTGEVTKRMTELVYLIARKIANGRNFYAYAAKEDMIQEGVWHAIHKGMPSFTEGRDNPFCYLSVVIQRKYIEYIKKEKKNIKIKEMATDRLKEDIRDSIKDRK
jgi:DNA-directed RNA polymerase specialized sigma24 family protein